MGKCVAPVVPAGLRHQDPVRQARRPAQQRRYHDRYGRRSGGRTDDPPRLPRRVRGAARVRDGGLRGHQGPLCPRSARSDRHAVGIYLSPAPVPIRSAVVGADRPDRARLPAVGRDAVYAPGPGSHLEGVGRRIVLRSGLSSERLVPDYGVNCLRFLEGMFAFALWDNRKKRLFIARDRLGEKPLHWAIFDNQFLFGSEIKAILANPAANRRLNVAAMEKYLALEYVPAPDSIFESINKLMPAHYMLIERGQIKIQLYWDSNVAQSDIKESEAKQKLLELLDRSVELRLISDVPLGIFLSGGIDSSTITALAARRSSKPIKTFSIAFADRSFDESEHAKMVARHIGTEHHVIRFQPEQAFETMNELWQILDEPIADPSILPTYFLSKMTRKSVTVALSGEGSDELFGGYPTYQAHRLAYLWNAIPSKFRHYVLESAIASLPVSLNNLSFDYKLKRFVAAINESPMRRHLQWMGAISLREQKKLIRSEFFGQAKREARSPNFQAEEELIQHISQSVALANKQGTLDVVDKAMRLDLGTYLPDDLLVKSDRASMAASLETRLPFLAYPLVEFALSLPPSLKVRGITTKYLLKKAAAPLLPHRTIHRPKKGFGIPVAKWLNNDFRSLTDEYLGSDFIQAQGIFNSNYIQELLTRHRQGQSDYRKELWTLLTFQCWWHKYLR